MPKNRPFKIIIDTNLKFYLPIFLIALTLQLSAQTSYEPSKKIKSPLLLGNFSATSIDSIVTKKMLDGNIVYINFWFATCPPCTAEIKALNKMYKKLRNHGHLKFLSLTFENAETIKSIVDKYRIEYPVFHLPKEDMNRLKFGKGYPTSMIIDSNGLIIYSKTGGSSNEKEATRIINKEVYPEIIKALNSYTK